MEHKILAALISSRDSWEVAEPHLSREDISPQGLVVLNHLKEYYDRDSEAKSVDIDLLKKRVVRGLDNPKHEQIFDLYFDNLKIKDVSSTNIVAEILEVKKHTVRQKLVDALLEQNNNRYTALMEDLMDLEAAEDLDLGVDEEFEGAELSDLLADYSEDNLIRVAPKSLNKELGGGALRGHHIVVVATPETGKSLTAINMTAGFSAQNLKSLYIGNEDPVVSLALRFASNLTGLNKQQIMEDPDSAMQLAVSRGYKNAVFVGLSPGTIPEIRSLIKKHEPDVLIVDQIRNVRAKSENNTNRLEAVAQAMRNFARKHNILVVSVTQGADSARNKAILDMGDVDGSNVGIPGACDVMAMIGMTEDHYAEDTRIMTLAKNKLTGSHRTWGFGIDRSTTRIIDPEDM